MAAAVAPMFRPEFSYSDSLYYEKRQAFLRSYQFSRKKSLAERIRLSLVRVKRVVWIRLRAARKLPRLFWLRIKIYRYERRRRFHRLVNNLITSNSNSDSFNSCW